MKQMTKSPRMMRPKMHPPSDLPSCPCPGGKLFLLEVSFMIMLCQPSAEVNLRMSRHGGASRRGQSISVGERGNITEQDPECPWCAKSRARQPDSCRTVAAWRDA